MHFKLKQTYFVKKMEKIKKMAEIDTGCKLGLVSLGIFFSIPNSDSGNSQVLFRDAVVHCFMRFWSFVKHSQMCFAVLKGNFCRNPGWLI